MTWIRRSYNWLRRRRVLPIKFLFGDGRRNDEASIGSIFDPDWYRVAYPDVAASGLDPLEHYLTFGAAEGRNPCVLFDTRWYVETYPDVAESGMNPLKHYIEHGAAEERDPGPDFSTRGYFALYPDVAQAGVNPLVHYSTHGQAEGRRRHAPRPVSAEEMLISEVFDPDWYRVAYPDVAASGLDPLEHYLTFGAAEGRNPCVLFDTRWYVETYPDVAESGMNPLKHYIEHGAAEGRDPGPNFSSEGYLKVNPDVSRSAQNPLLHYLKYGMTENRITITSKAYLEKYNLHPGRKAIQEAVDVLKEFEKSEYQFTQLLSEIETIQVSDIPQRDAKGWRRLFLSLSRAPRLLVVVDSIDSSRISKHLEAIGEYASALASPSDVLVVAADEQTVSVGSELSRRVDWRSLSEFGSELDANDRTAILVALIHNLRPMAVLVLNSHIGWRALAEAGGSIARYCGLFVAFPPPLCGSDFRLDLDLQREYLRDCSSHLSCIYVSDADTKARLGSLYGMSHSTSRKIQILPSDAPSPVWRMMMARHPGFLSAKRAVIQ